MKTKKTYNRKPGPSPKVVTKMAQPWTLRQVKRSMSVGNQEINSIPIDRPANIPSIKFNKIYTKQVDNSFKMTGYKCSLCHKLFSDDMLLESHPIVCPEIINNR